MNDLKRRVYRETAHKVSVLSNLQKSGRARAQLARLKKGAGRHLTDSLDAVQVVFEDIDPELLDSRPALNAVFTAETLYAIHQQGVSDEVAGHEGETIAAAMRDCMLVQMQELDPADTKKRFYRKMEPILKARSLEQLVMYIKNLISFMKGSKFHFRIDYARLASDLYSFQFPDRKAEILLQWAKDFYRMPKADNAARNAVKEEDQ